jgi:FAD/FMN-containing dehydrogenase
MRARLRRPLGLLVSASSVVLGDLCSDFQARNFVVDMPLSLAYEDEQQNYWSAACSAMRPRCILAPRTAQEVADIVTELHGTTDLFAIKSQGHMPNNGFASIDRGILVSLKNLNQVTYDPGTQTVVAGSGQTWAHLMEPLLEMGRTVVGGRLSDVGLGGYLLGGKSAAARYPNSEEECVY